ncbi:hypothetical protein NOI07_25315, partial [Escherichia coli]|nr:hypothetical protein [Escherichia coli]
RLRFSGPKTSIICSPMTSLKTSIKTITYLSDIGCLEIQGASLINQWINGYYNVYRPHTNNDGLPPWLHEEKWKQVIPVS